jgi:PAS domain S-box-containing protein
VLSAFLLNISATFVMVLGFNKGITKRISVIADNFSKFRRSNTLNPPQKGSDEISFLDKGFHELALELSEASAKDKAIFDNMPVGLIACDRLGAIESANPSSEMLLGTVSSDLIGHNFSDFIIADLQNNAAAAGIAKPNSLDLSLLRPDKYYLRKQEEKTFPAHISVSKYQHAGQEKLLFSFSDLSDREEVEKLKQEFVSIISHDLRAPLSSIKGCLLLLAEDKLGEIPEEAKKYVGMASQESDRLIRLTGDLLDIARIESGHIVLEKRPIACSELIERSTGAVKALAEAKSILIKAVPSEITITADGDRVCQILVNFLANAIKYSEANTSVTVSVEATDSFITFNVIDQGRGIPEELTASIFNRFRQVRAADAKEGTGLGLAICKLLAEAHGGSVGVESALAKGSKFWFRLPVS